MLRIVVSEYPRSGGTWLVNLIGDSLGLDKRDIYIHEGYSHYDARRHPWYAGCRSLNLTDHCVIKSHEFPSSALLWFPARYLHLVRDGRDAVVSKYFYEKELCVKNGIYERFDEPFDDYVPRVAAEWREFVEAWRSQDCPQVSYEELLGDTKGTLARLLRELGFEVLPQAVRRAVESNTKDQMRKSLDRTYDHNTFVRKGIAGDWLNHLQSRHLRAFDRRAGDLLVELGYEQKRSP
jgi:hypothetical protein